MRVALLTAALSALALLTATGTAGGQSEDTTVRVTKAGARFAHALRTGEPRHKVKLAMQVEPRSLPEQHDAEQHDLRVTLDGSELCAAPPASEGYRGSGSRRWRWRGAAAGGRVAVKADGRSGVVKIKITRAQLTHLRDSEAQNLPLVVEMGGAVLETEISLWVRDGRVRRWRGLLHAGGGGPGPVPGPDPDPDPGTDPPPGGDAPTGAELEAAIRADFATRGVQFFVTGSFYPAGGFDGRNKLCPHGKPAERVWLSSSSGNRTDPVSVAAYFCRDSRRYWANYTGGYAGANLWVGPFDLP